VLGNSSLSGTGRLDVSGKRTQMQHDDASFSATFIRLGAQKYDEPENGSCEVWWMLCKIEQIGVLCKKTK
jgi:hypothetical protein